MFQRFATVTIAVLVALLLVAPALADEAKGTIQSVGEDSLVMKIQGKDYKFSVGDETTVTLNGEEAELKDLKKGQSATVTYKKEGEKLTATKIVAKAAKDSFSVSFAALAPAAADDAADTLKGKIESVGEDNLVLNANGKRHKVSVGEECTITLNGEEAKLSDLKKGQTASVTAKREGGKLVATKIEVRAKAAGSFPAETAFALLADALKGEIESVGQDSLVLSVGGKQHRVQVGEEATITLNGEKATLKDLKKGQMATVTAKKDGEKLVATRIEAKSE